MYNDRIAGIFYLPVQVKRIYKRKFIIRNE